MNGSKPRSTPLHETAVHVAGTLIDAGFVAYFAGGCVRDRLRGEEPEDYDIATDAPPETVRRIFPNAHGVGESFGVMLVRSGGHTFEIATFRADDLYEDGRRPIAVRYTDAEEDARRRDFTINGLFEEPRTGRIVDFVDGVADLHRGVIRAIGDPAARFGEDHLRLLRTVRFAARLGFLIDPATAAAAAALAPKLRAIARERIGAELRRVLEHPSRLQGVALLHSLGLDGPVLDEPPAGPVSVEACSESLRHLSALPANAPFEVALAAWALDRSRPSASLADALGESAIARWRMALVLSNREESALRDLAHSRRAAAAWQPMGVAGRKRWAAHPESQWAELLLSVDDPSTAEGIAAWRRATDPQTIAPAPMIGGEQLLQLGLHPGPNFRPLIEAAYDAQLEGRFRNTEEAMRFVRNSLLSR